MGLRTCVVWVEDVAAAAYPGLPNWVANALPFQAELSDTYPDDMVTYFLAGHSPLPGSPPREGDSCDGAGPWVAQSALITLEREDAVLGGLPRYSFPGTTEGFEAALAAPLTDWTAAILCRTPNTTGSKFLLNVGTTSSTRLGIYLTGNDVAVQHGTGDAHVSSGAAVVADTWLPLICSFENSTKALRIYNGSTTPLLSSTMVNSPPADLAIAIGALLNGSTNAFQGEIPVVLIWTEAIHTDAAALKKLVAAMNGLSQLTAD